MKIYYKNHSFKYEIDNICNLFFSYERLHDNSNDYILTQYNNNEAIVEVSIHEQKHKKTCTIRNSDEKECERVMAVTLFCILREITNISPPWGILTGIRPVKLMRTFTSQYGLEFTQAHFSTNFLVSDEKIRLCTETMQNENSILKLSTTSSFSLYISIPFCPTRCSYCSFVSQSIEKAAVLIPNYVELLCEEIKYTASIVQKLNLHLETVYIGGGTPTTLNPTQLSTIIKVIQDSFDITLCREFTVEAGRPDTITTEKLQTLKDNGVTRVSINPQTLNDSILKSIGRHHTSAEALYSYDMARKYGFDSINMDLIAGLPDESTESFTDSVKKVLTLYPENITVHTLSLKRASHLNKRKSSFGSVSPSETTKMLDFVQRELPLRGYKPYYLYRQSNMIGNLENVGWSRVGHECLYNVFVMDETHTIIACGAGAVTKIKQPNGTKLTRIFNFKFAYEYKTRFEEIIKRKKDIITCYKKLL